ncbi:MAG: Na+/H+ antiporter NhaA [Bacteroidales bacterium]|nr:Na+/H+ antiporter NhaA [Bacteroidales bacterium]
MTPKKILSPIQKFIKAESFSGILLFFVTILALILANSPLSDFYKSIWQFEIGFKSGSFVLVKPLILWINDGLMAIFFFLIGLEIKREVLIGELNSLKKASLPIFAALGGMLIPLAMFLMLNENPDTIKGWGIPMATDIAFTLAILTLLGKRVPLGLKIFLIAFAIIDDIGAVLVIALFYTTNIAWDLLFYSGVLLGILYFLSYLKIHNKYLIFFFGFIIWFLFLKAGIHPTIAGILLALAVPIRQKITEFDFADKMKSIVDDLTKATNTNKLPILSRQQIAEIDKLEDWTNQVQSPLQQLENRLHKWVAFFIMPIFAFSNAGVYLAEDMNINWSLATNIILSLFLGKLIGVALFSFISVKLKMATLPEGVDFKQIIGIALLAGVGFTMSLFIGNLAFTDNNQLLDSAKIGIIIGSIISGILGYIVLRFSLNTKGS